MKRCSYTNHEECSFNEIYQLVNIKNQLRLVKMSSIRCKKIMYCRSLQMFCVHSIIQSSKKVSKLSIFRNYNNGNIYALSLRLNNVRQNPQVILTYNRKGRFHTYFMNAPLNAGTIKFTWI